MKASDFSYDLPPDLIARYPLERREASRMMVVDRANSSISHHTFASFPTWLGDGDLLVLNDSRVVPARFFPDDGGKEILKTGEDAQGRWICLVKPGRRFRAGHPVRIGDCHGVVDEILPDGDRVIRWLDQAPDPATAGHLALPPYFEREEEESDKERYQTVYAKQEGSVAAPTAGLHFTPELLQPLPHTFLTLHVGVGTFRPVKTEEISEHIMHSESWEIPGSSADAINQAKRVIAVGTTVTRVLEHVAGTTSDGKIRPGRGETSIFLKPGHEFRCVNALLTNFHLPRSTLLMLVSALAGRDLILQAYEEAVKERYRFFSYGDCMFIV